MIRRICFYAGPGSGKSTIAAKTFCELKIRHYDVEYISEYIKTWAYAGKKPISYDQVYVFAKQLHTEDATLQHVKHLVTDSPILMNVAYSSYYGFTGASNLIPIAQQFDEDFPALNFFIERTVPYQQVGRYQTLDKAVEFDNYLLQFLSQNLRGPLVRFKVEGFDNILEAIERRICDSKNT